MKVAKILCKGVTSCEEKQAKKEECVKMSRGSNDLNLRMKCRNREGRHLLHMTT